MTDGCVHCLDLDFGCIHKLCGCRFLKEFVDSATQHIDLPIWVVWLALACPRGVVPQLLGLLMTFMFPPICSRPSGHTYDAWMLFLTKGG
jgi:hypothetical protein